MENEENYLEFVTSENYKHQIDIWYKAYNVSREKIELFHDFLSSLYNSINKTYLGPDVLFSEYDQRGHFTWCWNKVINDFEKERIFFQKTGKHYEYFWSFFLEAFYLTNIDGQNIKITDYFDMLFNFKYRKSRSELDILIELYKLLNEGLKK